MKRTEEKMDKSINKKIVAWGKERGIVKPENTLSQLGKVLEELGELSAGINKNDSDKIIDSLGDIQVTLILLAADLGVDYAATLRSAYAVIENRKGKTINGVFVKEEDLK
ncbi:MAG: MazG-like family protein [Leuconostoc mesenteroides]